MPYHLAALFKSRSIRCRWWSPQLSSQFFLAAQPQSFTRSHAATRSFVIPTLVSIDSTAEPTATRGRLMTAPSPAGHRRLAAVSLVGLPHISQTAAAS